MFVQQAINRLNTTSKTVEALRMKMDEVASTLPEYQVVIGMYGVGNTLGPQLMAEIEDVTRFEKRTSLTAFDGVDPQINESGDTKIKSMRTTKKAHHYYGRHYFKSWTVY